MKPPRTESGEPPTSPDEIVISGGNIKVWSRLKGVKAALNKRYGEGEWGLDEVMSYFQHRQWKKWKEYLGEVDEDEEGPLDDCVAKYMEAFEGLTPNDMQGIMNLCALERQLGDIRHTLSLEKKDVKERASLSKIQDNLMREHRLQQEGLGIIRKSRRGEERTALDAIQEEIEKGKQFVEEKLIRIDHCNIQLGFVLYHFREIPHFFEFRCPRCGASVVIKGGSIDNLKAVLDKEVPAGAGEDQEDHLSGVQGSG